jgi:hypothetical protein
MHHGTLAASVTPQPSDLPLIVATPTARVEVLGTKFSIEAASKRTSLNVTEGLVRLVRLADREAVEVADGKRATVAEQTPLVAEDIPKLPNTWDVDFESGLPADWKFGEFVTQGLPKFSKGAIRAVRHIEDDGETYYSISIEPAWEPGLFAVRKGSHFHVTMKMDHPSWLNLFLGTRTADPDDPQFSGNFIFKEFPQLEPGKWITLSIPLERFRKLHDGPEPIDQLVPFNMIFNATGSDRGLVIDRLWVTPDGPGKVTVKHVD